MGVILGSGVVPIALCITWSKANRLGCIAGAIIGFGVGVAVWLGVTSALNEKVISVTVSCFVFVQNFGLRGIARLLDKRRCEQDDEQRDGFPTDIPQPGNYEMLSGNLASIAVGGIVSVIVSLIVCQLSIPRASRRY